MTSPPVAHCKGHGGAKGAVKIAQSFLDNAQHFVYKTDVQDFFQSIRHDVLLTQFQHITQDPLVIRLLKNYCTRVQVIDGYCHHTKHTSIPQSCSLAPVLETLYLQHIDALAKKAGVRYVRYMDDLLFVAKTRWQLKKVIKQVHICLAQLGQKISKAKTWIGRASQGFDFLDFHITSHTTSPSKTAIRRCLEKNGPAL